MTVKALKKKNNMSGPFKMKGSPMQRNFGIGGPMRKITKPELNEFGETAEQYKQRMIDDGFRKSDAQEEIESKTNKKASKKDKENA
tara:strand:- start:59 stop:316 length:258 start_codon:yes stop_codon:yes gene_type:complete